MTTLSPTCIKGGTITLNPFSSLAGLYEDAAVWPLTVGSVSVISKAVSYTHLTLPTKA